jgi:hypothetical protein
LIGLNTGGSQDQIKVEHRVIDAFNASHSTIDLESVILANYQTSADGFTTLVNSGNLPDLIGPVGMAYMDLAPLTRSNH